VCVSGLIPRNFGFEAEGLAHVPIVPKVGTLFLERLVESLRLMPGPPCEVGDRQFSEQKVREVLQDNLPRGPLPCPGMSFGSNRLKRSERLSFPEANFGPPRAIRFPIYLHPGP